MLRDALYQKPNPDPDPDPHPDPNPNPTPTPTPNPNPDPSLNPNPNPTPNQAGDTQQYMYRLRGKQSAAQLRSVSALGRMEVLYTPLATPLSSDARRYSTPPLATPLSSAAWRHTPLTTARRSEWEVAE